MGLEYFQRYHEKPWPNYQKILEANGEVIIKKHEVGKDGWTDLDDWMHGDSILKSGSSIIRPDLKTCGNYGGPVKITQLTDDRVDLDCFDFLDCRGNRVLYRMSLSKARDLYKEGKWYQTVNEKVNDKKSGLIRFPTEIIKSNSKELRST